LVEICTLAAAVVLGVLAAGVEVLGVDADELGVLEELPQPPSASSPTARTTAESRRCVFARPCA
jgi:hypothetical protein